MLCRESSSSSNSSTVTKGRRGSSFDAAPAHTCRSTATTRRRRRRGKEGSMRRRSVEALPCVRSVERNIRKRRVVPLAGHNTSAPDGRHAGAGAGPSRESRHRGRQGLRADGDGVVVSDSRERRCWSRPRALQQHGGIQDTRHRTHSDMHDLHQATYRHAQINTTHRPRRKLRGGGWSQHKQRARE